jgi:S1-C subfamily serine protease
MKTAALFLILSLLVSSCALTSSQLKTRRLQESKSVVIVLVRITTTDPITGTEKKKGWSGTGFSVSENENGSDIITNKHVCAAGNKATYELTASNGHKYPATFVRVAPGADVCLLRTKQQLPAVKLAGKDAEKGDEINVFGAPHGMLGLYTHGEVSGYEWVDMKDDDDFPFEIHCYAQLISAPIYPGSSGSPTFNSNGEVVGIVFAARGDSEHMAYQIPVSEIKRLLDRSQNVYER